MEVDCLIGRQPRSSWCGVANWLLEQPGSCDIDYGTALQPCFLTGSFSEGLNVLGGCFLFLQLRHSIAMSPPDCLEVD